MKHKVHGWKFVTNDGDFTNGGIEVLTSNPRLLSELSVAQPVRKKLIEVPLPLEALNRRLLN